MWAWYPCTVVVSAKRARTTNADLILSAWSFCFMSSFTIGNQRGSEGDKRRRPSASIMVATVLTVVVLTAAMFQVQRSLVLSPDRAASRPRGRSRRRLPQWLRASTQGTNRPNSGNRALQASASIMPGSGCLRQQFALSLADKRLERLGPGAAEFFDRVGHREACGLRVEAGGAERFPERGEMFDRVRIVAARERVAAPLVVRNFFIAHVLGQHAPEGRDDLLERDDRADHRIGGARRQGGAGQEADGDARHVLGGDQRKHGVFLAPGQPDRPLRRQAQAHLGAEILIEHRGPDMHRADPGPFEHLFGQIVLPHPRGRGIDRRLQHHQIDETGDTRFARGDRHGRGRVEQTVLYWIGKIDRRGALDRALDGADVEEVAFDYFGALGPQRLRAFVDLVDEGADRNSAFEQHFGYVPPGLALPAAGR